jgi:hypothetical protein
MNKGDIIPMETKMSIAKYPIIAACAVLLSMPNEVKAAPCDLSWVGSGVAATPTGDGEVVVVLGADNNLRLNEWKNSTNSWQGWVLLPKTYPNILDPSIQYYPGKLVGDILVEPPNYSVFVHTTNGIAHYRCIKDVYGDWHFSRLDIPLTASPYQVANPTAAVLKYDGSMELFSVFMDGSLKSITYTGAIGSGPYQPGGTWSSNWKDYGISGTLGSPSATQLPMVGGIPAVRGGWAVLPTCPVNLYIRMLDNTMKVNVWNGSVWSGWLTTGYFNGAQGNPVSVQSDYQYLFAGSKNGTFQEQYWNAGLNRWTGWAVQSFPGSYSLAPVSSTNANFKLYGVDNVQNVWQGVQNGTNGVSGSSQVNCLLPPT